MQEKKEMKAWLKELLGYMLLGIAVTVAMSGCAARELEDRSFPSALIVTETDIGRQLEASQLSSEKFIDYGHLKALLLPEAYAKNREILKDTLVYLEENPVFSRNIPVFFCDEAAMETAKVREEDVGEYLEDIYKNQPVVIREEPVTLKEVLNFFHNMEAEIAVPKLTEKGGRIVPDGKAKVRFE